MSVHIKKSYPTTNGRDSTLRTNVSAAVSRSACMASRCPAPFVHGSPESFAGKLHSVTTTGFPARACSSVSTAHMS